VVILMLLGYVLHFMPKRLEFQAEETITRLPLIGQALCLTAVIVLVLQMKLAGVQPFIYFQF